MIEFVLGLGAGQLSLLAVWVYPIPKVAVHRFPAVISVPKPLCISSLPWAGREDHERRAMGILLFAPSGVRLWVVA